MKVEPLPPMIVDLVKYCLTENTTKGTRLQCIPIPRTRAGIMRLLVRSYVIISIRNLPLQFEGDTVFILNGL